MTIHFSRYLSAGSEVAAQTTRGAQLLASIPRDSGMTLRLNSAKSAIAGLRTKHSAATTPQTIREVLAASLL